MAGVCYDMLCSVANVSRGYSQKNHNNLTTTHSLSLSRKPSTAIIIAHRMAQILPGTYRIVNGASNMVMAVLDYQWGVGGQGRSSNQDQKVCRINITQQPACH